MASDCRPPAAAGTDEWTERELCSLPTVLMSTEGIETISAGKLAPFVKTTEGGRCGTEREREEQLRRQQC